MVILFFMGLTLSLALLDIVAKSYVENSMKLHEEHTVCKGNIIFRKVYNRGMCLNMFDKNPEFVKGISAIVTMILTIYQCLTLLRKGRIIKKFGLSLMAAGAWSNTFDRWIRGYVIDFIGFKTKWKEITRITYNLGDFFIGVGAVILVLLSMFTSKKRKS